MRATTASLVRSTSGSSAVCVATSATRARAGSAATPNAIAIPRASSARAAAVRLIREPGSSAHRYATAGPARRSARRVPVGRSVLADHVLRLVGDVADGVLDLARGAIDLALVLE